MSVNQEPPTYQHKHQERIILSEYTGVASGIMQLNEPVADGFMRVTDMRKNILVVRKGEARTISYDQIGEVKVGKMTLIATGGRSQKSDVMYTNWNENDWVIEINDQELWKRVSADESKGNQTTEQKFIAAFRNEVRKGSKEFLRQEKVFNNGGRPSPHVTNSYLFFGVIGMLDLAVAAGVYTAGLDPIEYGAKELIFTGTGNLLGNTVNWWMPRFLGPRAKLHNTGVNMPFVRKSMPEFIMPTIPIDRLVRGLAYDAMHGSKIIT